MTYSAEVLADSPQLYLRLDGGSGTDSSGNGHNTTGGTAPSGVAGLLVGDADGAGSFNGTTQSFLVAWASWMNTTNFSAEFLLKTTQTSAALVVARDSGSQRLWQVGINTTGNVGKLHVTRILNAANSVAVITTVSTINVNDGVARHFAVTYDGTTLRLYINGSLDASSAWTGGIYAGNAAITVADYYGGGFLYSGILDEVAYYTADLSGARVAAHYAAAVGGDITVSGEAFSAPLTALDGSALTAVQVAGEAFASTVTMLDGAVSGTTVAGEAFAVTATMLDGGPVGAGVTVTGESFTSSVTVLDGSVVAATDTSNALDGLDITFTGTVTVTRPPAEAPPSLVLGEKYDKAIAYPVPVMVDGRPT